MKIKAEAGSQDSVRLKRQSSDAGVERFDFDAEEYEIDPRKKLKLVTRGVSSGNSDAVGTQSPDGVNAFEKRATISKMILDIKRNDIFGTAPILNAEPALDDRKYINYHRRMLRQESRMIQLDITHGENEADRLLGVYDKLNMFNWQPTLLKVTMINDPNDEEEMLAKREKTKEYIQTLLNNFDNMKKRTLSLNKKNAKYVKKIGSEKTMLPNSISRSDSSVFHGPDRTKIYNYVDRKYYSGYVSSSDEEEECMTVEDIKAHRKASRERQCGSALTVCLSNNFNAGYAIVAEPLKKPYIIKCTTQERKHWKNIRGDGDIKKFKVYHPPTTLVANLTQRISCENTLKPKSVNELRNPNEDNEVIDNDQKQYKNADILLPSEDSVLSDVPSSLPRSPSIAPINLLPVKKLLKSTVEETSTLPNYDGNYGELILNSQYQPNDVPHMGYSSEGTGTTTNYLDRTIIQNTGNVEAMPNTRQLPPLGNFHLENNMNATEKNSVVLLSQADKYYPSL